MAKLNMLYMLSTNCLTVEVDKFWEGVNIPPNKLLIDADNMLGIFSYILVQSGDKDFIADLKFLSKFVTKTIEVTSRGYQLISYQTCI